MIFWYFLIKNNTFFSKILPAKLQRVKLLQIGRYQLKVLSLTPTLFSYLFSFLLDMTSSLILVSYVIFSHYVIFSIFLSSYKKSSFNSLTFVYLPFGVTLLSKKGETGDPSIIGAAASGVHESAQWERSLLALPLPAVSRMSSSLIL